MLHVCMMWIYTSIWCECVFVNNIPQKDADCINITCLVKGSTCRSLLSCCRSSFPCAQQRNHLGDSFAVYMERQIIGIDFRSFEALKSWEEGLNKTTARVILATIVFSSRTASVLVALSTNVSVWVVRVQPVDLVRSFLRSSSQHSSNWITHSGPDTFVAVL